jgi:hypothetical protein
VVQLEDAAARVQRVLTQIKPGGASRQWRFFTQATLSLPEPEVFWQKIEKLFSGIGNFFMNPKTFFLFKIIGLRRAGPLNADQETDAPGHSRAASKGEIHAAMWCPSGDAAGSMLRNAVQEMLRNYYCNTI